jgi:hypothetical protein
MILYKIIIVLSGKKILISTSQNYQNKPSLTFLLRTFSMYKLKFILVEKREGKYIQRIP